MKKIKIHDQRDGSYLVYVANLILRINAPTRN